MKKILFVVVAIVAFAQIVSAQGTSPSQPAVTGSSPSQPTVTGSSPGPKTVTGSSPAESAMGTLPNPLKVKSLSELLYKTVDFILSLSYIVIAFFFLLSGFKFVVAQGSEDKLSEAKRMFFNTVIGAIIIIGAQTIIAVLKSLFESLQR